MILQKVTFWRDLAQIIFKVYQTLLRLLRIKFKSPISIPRILDRRYLNNSPASFSLLSVSFDTVAKLLQLTRAKKGSGLAQLVEQSLPTTEVRGSNLVMGEI